MDDNVSKFTFSCLPDYPSMRLHMIFVLVRSHKPFVAQVAVKTEFASMLSHVIIATSPRTKYSTTCSANVLPCWLQTCRFWMVNRMAFWSFVWKTLLGPRPKPHHDLHFLLLVCKPADYTWKLNLRPGLNLAAFTYILKKVAVSSANGLS